MKANNLIQQHSLRKIKEFCNFRKGWHFNEGVPPTKKVARKATILVERAIMSMFDTDVFPGIDGELMVTIYHKNHYLEFTIETNEQVTFVYQIDDKDVVYEEDLSFDSALKKLNDFSEKIWNTSELSTESIMTQERENLKAWPLETHQMAAYQLSQENALKQPIYTSVNTYLNFIPMSRQPLQSIGYSDPMIYQMSMISSNIKVAPEMNAMEIL